MKTFNPFQNTVKEIIDLDHFTFGVEVEFYATDQYFNKVQNPSYNILGIDGAGKPTGEYRSPVFKSNSPKIAFTGAVRFTNQVLSSLISSFQVDFLPMKYVTKKIKSENPLWCSSCQCYHTDSGVDYYGHLDDFVSEEKEITKKHPLGIHFSLGGKYFKEPGLFTDIYGRSDEVQKQLFKVVETPDLYFEREKHYCGNLSGDNAKSVKRVDDNFSDLNRTPDRIRLLEFRFLPSCYFPSIVPYMTYIMLGGKVPTSTITNYIGTDKNGV